MKKCLNLFGVVVLWAILAAAAAADPAVLELSLEQAITQALDHNLDLHLIKIDLEEAQKELNRALIIDDAEMIESAQTKLEELEQKYANAKQDLTTKVRTAYYELLQQEASAANQEKALNRAKTQLAIDQAKFDAGVISTLDLQRSKNSLLNAENAYQNALITLETKYLEFNNTLGLNLAIQVILTDQINVDFVPFELKLEQAYQLALNHDQTIKTAKEALTKAVDAVNAADNEFTPRVELEKALAEQKKAEVRLMQAETNLYFKIRSEYYQIKNAAENVRTKERELYLEQQILQAEETKYAAGVISNQAVVAQQEKLAQAEDAYTQALWNYSQLRDQFLINIGLEPISSGGAGNEA
ncbi:MAG: TolC family protein [Firmicutes bacterium]|jgi:outer membrane protein TolC|nr:TolC family protein [Bacillota bacterium]